MKVIRVLLRIILSLILLIALLVAIPWITIKHSYKSNVKEIAKNNIESISQGKHCSKVDPFIGTGGFPVYTAADNYPGPSMPFGMVRLSPDTDFFLRNTIYSRIPVINMMIPEDKMVSTGGYYYADNRIVGFSHTRLAGTGASEGGHFRVIPDTEDNAVEKYLHEEYNSFSHETEVALPGYYSVELGNDQILAELSASERVGIHRYTFPGGTTPRILIDVASTLKGRTEEGLIQVYPEKNEICGHIRTFGSFGGRYGGIKVYFVAQTDQNIIEHSTWDAVDVAENRSKASGKKVGTELVFQNSNAKTTVNLRLAISYVSMENARLNLQAETEGKQFDDFVSLSQKSWERDLSLVEIEGGTEEQQEIFYTALYRSFQMPTVFNDVNGQFIGFDKKIHQAEGFRYFTDLSLWDTFRTIHPLYTLLKPHDHRDMLVSLVEMSKHGGGKLPRWPSGGGYTGSMLGASADIVISEAYQKGIRDFDVETAYEAMRKVALGIDIPTCDFNARRGAKEYNKYKYCPAEMMDQAVSRTLEYAYADDAISRLAKALGKEDDAALFLEHSKYYKNVWNPDNQYFHARNSDGTFVKDFDPLKLTYLDFKEKYTNDYVEGSALQWRWALFFDGEGLVSLFESPEYFVRELNDFFAKSDPQLGKWTPGSYYWHGNEPDIHAAYLFNAAGRPDLTQKWVRWIVDHKYSADYFGIEGDDDAGTLSSWYVFSSLGFFPVAGSDIYQLGAPLFKSARIKMGDYDLHIKTKNYSPTNIYVKQVWLNGEKLDRTWFKHEEIAKGGELVFEMNETPN